MNIPLKIKIGGHEYKVIKNYHFHQNSDLRAQADHNLQEIRIQELDHSGLKVHQEKIEEAFLHEIIHSINCVFLNCKLIEDDVAKLSEGLYSVIKNNKLF